MGLWLGLDVTSEGKGEIKPRMMILGAIGHDGKDNAGVGLVVGDRQCVILGRF